jgi:hypothetical protein
MLVSPAFGARVTNAGAAMATSWLGGLHRKRTTRRPRSEYHPTNGSDRGGVSWPMACVSLESVEVDKVLASDPGALRGAAERQYIASQLRKRTNQKPAPSVAGLKDTSLVPPVGFEPTTFCSEDRRSNPLS